MDLPLLSACFAALALTLYGLLDGFDLGVGTLLLLQRCDSSRDHMIDSITPTWDGNETWLVMTGITLFTAFPIAYAILMPAFYLPLIIMLLALGVRGVAFEFRVQMSRYRRRWDLAFGIGSVVTSYMQGLILGGLLQGVAITNGEFSGTVFDAFRPLPLLTGVIVVVGYSMLGSGWLYLKGNAEILHFSLKSLRIGTPAFLLLLSLGGLYAASIQPGIRMAWVLHPVSLPGLAVLMILAGGFLTLFPRSVNAIVPLILGFAVILFGMTSVALIVFPNIIPFRLTLWDAAAGSASQTFLLVGAIFVTPIILAYSAFAYWIFRGRTPENGWVE
jgi:cytochrome bd ubiquinol oxidase subunit II